MSLQNAAICFDFKKIVFDPWGQFFVLQYHISVLNLWGWNILFRLKSVTSSSGYILTFNPYPANVENKVSS